MVATCALRPVQTRPTLTSICLTWKSGSSKLKSHSPREVTMGMVRPYPFQYRVVLPAALLVFLCVVACAQQSSAPKSVPIYLPGANGLVMLDYFSYDPGSARLWVPAGNLGSVDVIDTNTDQVSQVGGFPTAQVQFKGKLRTMGPSSVTVGD